MPIFKHSGSLGDLIYALPTMRALGGGTLCLNPRGWWRQSIDHTLVLLSRLLLAQPYVHQVKVLGDEKVDYDLDVFRIAMSGSGWHRFANIADLVLLGHGLDTSERDLPWLSVPPRQGFRAKLVVHVGSRWRSPFFNWRRFVAERGPAVFVGLPQEHADFEAAFGKIDYHPTADLYEVAQIIAAADGFAGSQSCPYTIAEAMKKPVVLEVSPGSPNGLFHRPGRESYMVF